MGGNRREESVEKAFVEVFIRGRCLYLISVCGIRVASCTYLNQKKMVCVFFFFKILFIYLRERERACAHEPVHEQEGRGRGRGKSRLSAEQEAQCGAQTQDPGIMT